MRLTKRSWAGCALGARLALGRRVLLSRRLVPHLLAVMLNDAPGGGAYNGMMACDMTDHAADSRAFQTAFGGSHPCKQTQRHGDDYSDQKIAHGYSFEPRYSQNPAGRQKLHFPP
jgi:hypothetical protein